MGTIPRLCHRSRIAGKCGEDRGRGGGGEVTAAGKMDPELMRLAAILLVGAIAALLDTTIVNVAIRTIGGDLHAPLGTVQWVIAFRVVQGIGGGLLVPVLTTLLAQAAGGRPLGKLMATVSLPAVLVPILGPVAGGLIVSNLSWRWIFYVNVPICLAALVLAWRGMSPSPGTASAPRLYVVGLALLSPAVALMLYGLAQVSADGGFAHRGVLVPLAARAVLLASFIGRALGPPLGRHRRVTPLIDLRLLRVRSFSGASGLMFLSGLSMYGALFLLPLYYQQVRRASALTAGLLLAPQGIGALLPRTLAGRLTTESAPGPSCWPAWRSRPRAGVHRAAP